MPNYITRIELHGGTEETYDGLHQAMARRGFFREIQGDDVVRYLLPAGSYVIQNTKMTLQNATDAATAAAKETQFEHSIIVNDFNSAQWTNLRRAS